jgi:hypothetical protein
MISHTPMHPPPPPPHTHTPTSTQVATRRHTDIMILSPRLHRHLRPPSHGRSSAPFRRPAPACRRPGSLGGPPALPLRVAAVAPPRRCQWPARVRFKSIPMTGPSQKPGPFKLNPATHHDGLAPPLPAQAGFGPDGSGGASPGQNGVLRSVRKNRTQTGPGPGCPSLFRRLSQTDPGCESARPRLFPSLCPSSGFCISGRGETLVDFDRVDHFNYSISPSPSIGLGARDG